LLRQAQFFRTHARVWFQHARVWFQHEECDFHTLECYFHTQSAISTQMSAISTLIFLIQFLCCAFLGLTCTFLQSLTQWRALIFSKYRVKLALLSLNFLTELLEFFFCEMCFQGILAGIHLVYQHLILSSHFKLYFT
jgi:hypothetical protein